MAIRVADGLTGPDLLRFVQELLVVREAFLCVGNVFLEGVLGIFRRQCGQAVAVEHGHVIKIPAVGKSVLSDDDVVLAIARGGGMFYFHTDVLSHRRRPVCSFSVVAASAALGPSVVNQFRLQLTGRI